MKPLISISVPVYNEEANIVRLLHRLRAVTDQLEDYRFEFVFTDNASTDGTFALLVDAARKDTRIRVIRFTRNFGFQKSILTNLIVSSGDAVIQIDADLQDPPELFGAFLEKWEAGYKVVYGLRRGRKEGLLLKAFRNVGYATIDRLSETHVPRGAGDFRLLDREVIDQLRLLNDQSPYLRGMVALLGHAHIGIPYDREARRAGISKFGLGHLVALGIDGLCSQSTKLLRMITVTGLALALLTGGVALIYIGAWAIGYTDAERGFTTLALLLLFSIAMNAVFIGIVGEYVGRIFNNTRRMPITIWDDAVNVENVGALRVAEDVQPSSVHRVDWAWRAESPKGDACES